MQKIFYFLLLIPILSFSQAPRGFYIAAGGNSTMLESSDLESESAIGFRGGLTFNWGYNENYNYQAEFYVNQSYLNFKTFDGSSENTTNSKYAFQTAEFGLYFNYYILKPEEDKFFLGVQAGPSISISPSLKPKGGKDVTNETYAPHSLKEYDLTLLPEFLVNGGVGLTGGYNDFRFDLRYTHGFSNLMKEMKVPGAYDESNRYTGPELEGNVRMITFSVGYRLSKLFGGE